MSIAVFRRGFFYEKSWHTPVDKPLYMIYNLMDCRKILDDIKSHKKISDDDSFLLAQKVSCLILDEKSRTDGTNILIYVADNWENMPRLQRICGRNYLSRLAFIHILNS